MALGVFLILFSIGANWVYVTAGGLGIGLNALDLSGRVLPYYTQGHVPDNTTFDGEVVYVLLPSLTSSAPLVIAEWAFPISFFLGFLAFFRWRLLVATGLSGLVSGVSWILGIESVQGVVVSKLQSYPGFLGHPGTASLVSEFGPYIAASGGLVLLLCYVLCMLGKLDPPD